MELININTENAQQAVNARELHSFLGSKQDFSTWIKNRIDKYGFIEDTDFTLHKFMEGKVWKHEYALTLDCAKEIAMVQGNAKGKQARQYFIEKEKELREIKKELSPAEMFMQSAKMYLEQEQKIKEIAQDVSDIKAKLITRPECYSVAGYAAKTKKYINLSSAKVIGGKASRYCKARGIKIDTIHDPRFGKVNTYPVEVLKEFF